MSIVKLPSTAVVAAADVPETHLSVTVPDAIAAPVAAVPLRETVGVTEPPPPPQALNAATSVPAVNPRNHRRERVMTNTLKVGGPQSLLEAAKADTPPFGGAAAKYSPKSL
jgi:hypothetical protein